MYSILLSCTEDDAFRICHSVKEGNGLEAMRLLMKRYEPRTPGTKRAGKGDNCNGGSKGDGQGKGGKGSGFNGYCHQCGEWGHSQSHCRRKNGKGNSKGGYEQIAHNGEENKNQLENLEKSGCYRCLCSLEHRGSRCVTSNLFAALQELNEDEEMSVGTGTLPGLTVGDFITVKSKYQKKTKDREVNQQTCFGDLNTLEVNTVQ